MSGEDDSGERSQEPTQKRLDQAQRDGKVLSSKDLVTFTTLAAATLLATAAPALGPWIATHWAASLRIAPATSLDDALMPALVSAGQAVIVLSALVAMPVALAAIVTQLGMGGLHWIPKGYAFRAEKLDPIKGLGRMVSVNALVELIKAIAKVSLLLAATAWVVMAALPELAGLGAMALGDTAAVLTSLVLRLLVALTLVLGLIGLADFAWSWYQHTQSLRMSLAEVRREMREDNGSPELKGRQRQMAQQASRRSRERAALPDVAEATAVITNPTHFAVALRYRPGTDAAPHIVATGSDHMAQEVIKRARRAGVPVLGMPPLARALYFTGDIGAPIHEGLFSAVAAVIAHVWRVERGLREAEPEIDLPPELRFNAYGRRQP